MKASSTTSKVSLTKAEIETMKRARKIVQLLAGFTAVLAPSVSAKSTAVVAALTELDAEMIAHDSPLFAESGEGILVQGKVGLDLPHQQETDEDCGADAGGDFNDDTPA